MLLYVELRRPEYFGLEVEAETAEAAIDQALLAAPGIPADWEVISVQRAEHRATGTPEPGAVQV
jgi:hypothetical protein